MQGAPPIGADIAARPSPVTPAKAGVQGCKLQPWVFATLDSRVRGNDEEWFRL